jgi:hypothetical protein
VSLESDFVAWLKLDPGIVQRVGDRIHKGIPQRRGLATQLVYNRISTTRQRDLGGGDPLPRVRLQVDCWAGREGDDRELADYLTGILEASPRQTWNGRDVAFAAVDNDFDASRMGAEAGADKGRGDLYRTTLEVVIWAQG